MGNVVRVGLKRGGEDFVVRLFPVWRGAKASNG